MIILSTTSDVMRVVTSAALALDVHCSFVDSTSTVYAPGRQNTTISTASTTTVLSAPPAATRRQLKKLTAHARGGANTITAQFFDGTTAFQAVSIALAIGETLEYEDAKGWRVLDTAGEVKTTATGLTYTTVSTVAPGATRLKEPATVVATGNVTLSGTAQTVDGIPLATPGVRVLLSAQTTGTENGIWLVQSGAWTRPTDFAQFSDAASALVVVQYGTTFAKTIWLCTTTSYATVDFTATVWAQVPTAGNGLTFSGQTLHVVANADGSIVVHADDVQVGVLASDAQHGVRGGGTQHALATTSVAGFQSPTDKTKIDAIALTTNGFASVAGGIQTTNPSGTTTTLGPGGSAAAGNLRLIATYLLDLQCTTIATGSHAFGFDLSTPGDGVYLFSFEFAAHVTSDGTDDSGFIFQKGMFRRNGGNAIGVYAPAALAIGGAGVGGTTLVAGNTGASALWTITPTLGETRTIDWAGRVDIKRFALT